MKNANWIWHGDPGYDLVNSWMQARREFTLKSVPTSAPIEVTADTQYRLYVNGIHLLRGPARGFQKSWPYDEIDIAPYLRKGRNVLAVLVHQNGISTFQYIHQGHAGLLLEGSVGDEDLSTGPRWRVRPAPGYQRVTARVSLQLGFQECFDARLDDDAWLHPGYDDSSWLQPKTRPLGCEPWPALEVRGIPHLREEVRFPQAVVSAASGKCVGGPDVVRQYAREKRLWKKSKAGLPLDVPATGKGKFTAVCVDFGREVVGSLRLSVEGAAGGEIVDTIVTEGLRGLEPGILDPHTSHCREAFGNRLILRPGRTDHEQFDYWGFRYAVVIVRNTSKKIRLALKLHGVGYPMELKGDLRTDNERINRIYELSTWTQQCCMLDAYVDCPWREQAQWWGDARVQAANTFFLSADSRLFARGIRQLAAQELDNGLTYGHAPTMAHNCILPDFTLTWILTHRDYWWQTGDLRLFNEMKPRVHRALDYFHQFTADHGLLIHDPRYWLFLDWCPIFKEGAPTLYNLFYLAALRAAVELFRLSGELDAAARYAAREQKLLAAIRSRLFKDGRFYGGLDGAGKPVEQNSAHVYAWAILLDLYPECHAAFVEKHLLPVVQGKHADPLTPSPFFMTYIFDALKKTGRLFETLTCIERWWGEMVDRGLTTAIEVWSAAPGNGSLCHAWSAHPIVHLSNILLGVWQTGAAWETIRFSPTFAHAERAHGRVATPRGAIAVGWEKAAASIRVSLELPPGVWADVELPGARRQRVQGHREWTLERPTRRLRIPLAKPY